MGPPDYQLTAREFVDRLSTTPLPEPFVLADLLTTSSYRDYVVCWAWIQYAHQKHLPVRPYDRVKWEAILLQSSNVMLFYDESLHFKEPLIGEWKCMIAVVRDGVADSYVRVDWTPRLFSAPKRGPQRSD